MIPKLIKYELKADYLKYLRSVGYVDTQAELEQNKKEENLKNFKRKLTSYDLVSNEKI